jgi:hypothetical protein
MKRIEVVRRLYDQLDARGQAAVREATHDPAGALDTARFAAKYNGLPTFGTLKEPTPLRLFLPRDWTLPTDLHALLRTFVPEPEAASVRTLDALPAAVPEAHAAGGGGGGAGGDPLRPGHGRRRAAGGPGALAAGRGGQDSRQRESAGPTRRPSTRSGPAVHGDYYEASDSDPGRGRGPYHPGLRLALLLQGADLPRLRGRGGVTTADARRWGPAGRTPSCARPGRSGSARRSSTSSRGSR